MKVLNKKLTDFCFKEGDREFISADGHGAKYVKDRKSGLAVFTLKKAVIYLLQNVSLKIRNRTFREITGIPMGLNPAPSFSNLFLHFNKSRWIQQFMKSGIKTW